MEDRFTRLNTLAKAFPGAEKATAEMIELQALSLVSQFVNFWRFTIQENRFSVIYPSTLVLIEAPTGSGKNGAYRFMQRYIFGFPFRFMLELLREEEKAKDVEKVAELAALYDMDNPDESLRQEKKFEKAKAEYFMSKRDLEAILSAGDDATYEGFGRNRAYLGGFKLGGIVIKSEEFLDRLKAMKRNVFLQSFYGRLLELIDHDVLAPKITKHEEAATPGSEGMGTTLYLSMPLLDGAVREDVKSYVLSSIGRRGFLLRETNQTISFRGVEELDEHAVSVLEQEIAKLAEHLAELGGCITLDFTPTAKEWYLDYQTKYKAWANDIYLYSPSSAQKDVKCALMQDLDRKIMKVGALLAVFNHGEDSLKIKVEDLEQAKGIVERAYRNAERFFDMSEYSHTNTVLSYLQTKSPRWVSAKEMMDDGLFPNVGARGYQGPIAEIMMRDIVLAAQDKGFNLESKVHNRQDRYRLVEMDEATKNLIEFENTLNKKEMATTGPAEIEYQFSYRSDPNEKTTDGWVVKELSDLVTALKRDCQYSAVEFKHGKRLGENFIRANLLIIDVDEGFTLKEAARVFKPYWCILATTKSHQKPKKSKRYGEDHICDRFRIILKSDMEFTDGNEFKLVMAKLLPMVNADTQTVDTARFYWGSSDAKVMQNNNGNALFPASVMLKTLKLEAQKRTMARSLAVGASNGTMDSPLIDLTGKGERVDALAYAKSLPMDGETHPICCPFHDDRNPSAFIAHHHDGRVQITCSGCGRTEWIKQS